MIFVFVFGFSDLLRLAEMFCKLFLILLLYGTHKIYVNIVNV